MMLKYLMYRVASSTVFRSLWRHCCRLKNVVPIQLSDKLDKKLATEQLKN